MRLAKFYVDIHGFEEVTLMTDELQRLLDIGGRLTHVEVVEAPPCFEPKPDAPIARVR